MVRQKQKGSIRQTNRALPTPVKTDWLPDQKRVRTPVVTSTWLVAPNVEPTV